MMMVWELKTGQAQQTLKSRSDTAYSGFFALTVNSLPRAADPERSLGSVSSVAFSL